MAKIAYLLLCHRNAPRVLEQARILTARGDYVVIHMDARAPSEFRGDVASGTADNPNVVLAKSIKCGWGEWSLVQATLNMVTAAHEAFLDASHFFLMSGDCMPTKPAEYIRAALAAADRDHIEHADFFADGWIKTGMQDDRLTYRHWFNERRQKGLFYRSLDVQRKLGLRRAIPSGLRMRIGSQWWVLRRGTIDKILAFLNERPDIVRFFRTTWIPDETFFQTLTMHLVPRTEVISAPPTYLMFSDYGMPVTFCADHYDLLRTQGSFFARKISDHDDALRARLGALFVSDESVPETVDTGRALYDYVRRRGRTGQRFATRIWEQSARLGRDRHVTLIVCKKWHVAKRLVGALRDVAGKPSFGYIFDEDDAGLPEIGNFEHSQAKRNRHRRAFLNLLMAQTDARTVSLCLDPSHVAAIEDFGRDGCQLQVLEIDCHLDDAWLEGHATRIGLGSRTEAGALHKGLIATLRMNIEEERSRIRDMALPGHRVVHQNDTPGALARPIADTCGLSIDAAGQVARHANLSAE